MKGGRIPVLKRAPGDVCIPSVCHHKKSTPKGYDIRRPHNDSHGFAVATQRVVSKSVVSAGGRASTTFSILELTGLASQSKVSLGLDIIKLHARDLSSNISKNACFSVKALAKGGFPSRKILKSNEPLSLCGQTFAIGIVAGMLIHADHLFPR